MPFSVSQNSWPQHPLPVWNEHILPVRMEHGGGKVSSKDRKWTKQCIFFAFCWFSELITYMFRLRLFLHRYQPLCWFRTEVTYRKQPRCILGRFYWGFVVPNSNLFVASYLKSSCVLVIYVTQEVCLHTHCDWHTVGAFSIQWKWVHCVFHVSNAVTKSLD